MESPIDTARRASARDCLGPLACFVGLGLFVGVWAAILPAIKAATHVSNGELGLALLVGSSTTPVVMWLAGPLVERLGPRVLAVAAGIFALTTVLPALANSFPTLVGTLLVLGSLAAMLDVTMNVAISTLEAYGRNLMHLAHSLFSAGMLAGSLLSGAARHLGADSLSIVVVLAIFLGAVAFLNFRLPSVELKAQRTEPAHNSAPQLRRRFRLPAPYLLTLGAIGCLAFVFEGGIESWSALHLEETLNVEPGISALGPAAFAAAMMIGRLGGQWVTNRIDPYKLLVGAGLVGLTGVLIAALAMNAPLAIAGFLIAAMGLSICAPTFYGLAGRFAEPGKRGNAMSTVTSISWMGAVVGPAYIGVLAGAFDLRSALVCVALLGLPLAVLSLIARRLAAFNRGDEHV